MRKVGGGYVNMAQLQLDQKKHVRGKQRVKEAITCFKLSGHDSRTGLLLDLGCGFGHVHGYFLKNGIKAVGVELNRSYIKVAKKNVPKGNFVLADGCKLPFKKESFSSVVSNDVLEHVPYNLANQMLSEVKRTIKTTGQLYISVANKYQIQEPHTLIPFLTWFPRPCWNAIHKILRKRSLEESYYPYTINMLKRLCKETKFTYKNFTWLYALNKTAKTDYIGNRKVRKIAQTINKIGFTRGAQIIAEKVSIIVFVCNV